MKIAELNLHSFGKREALGGREGIWRAPSHPVSLLLAPAERLVEETKEEEFWQAVSMPSFWANSSVPL